jgi:nucleotide-binding universal stress UspA family protein
MFKNILVAADGSVYSRRAMAAAAEIAKLSSAQIELLYVFSDPQSQLWPDCYGDACPFSEEVCQQIRDQIDEFAKHVFDRTLEDVNTIGVAVKKTVMTGYPASRSVEASQRADLLVMGLCGYSPLEGTLVGSVTQRVMTGADCPILVVK